MRFYQAQGATKIKHKKATRRSLFVKGFIFGRLAAGKNYRPFFERRVPAVAPWRALNFGFDLQIT